MHGQRLLFHEQEHHERCSGIDGDPIYLSTRFMMITVPSVKWEEGGGVTREYWQSHTADITQRSYHGLGELSISRIWA